MPISFYKGKCRQVFQRGFADKFFKGEMRMPTSFSKGICRQVFSKGNRMPTSFFISFEKTFRHLWAPPCSCLATTSFCLAGPPFADKFFQKEMRRGFNPHTGWPFEKPKSRQVFQRETECRQVFQREKSRQVFQRETECRQVFSKGKKPTSFSRGPLKTLSAKGGPNQPATSLV